MAEEVRNLARRSAEAAKTTADLIEGSHKNAEAGVAVTAEVAQNAAHAEESASASGDLSNQVQELNAMMEQLLALMGGGSRKTEVGTQNIKQEILAGPRASCQNYLKKLKVVILDACGPPRSKHEHIA